MSKSGRLGFRAALPWQTDPFTHKDRSHITTADREPGEDAPVAILPLPVQIEQSAQILVQNRPSRLQAKKIV
jgi:hypothetical protein